MFQGVHETICFGPAATGWQEDEEPINQIVFIGRDLDRKVGAGQGRRLGACAGHGERRGGQVTSAWAGAQQAGKG